MVHRFLAALGRQGRSVATAALAASVATSVVVAPSTAHAFCRTTTCAAKRMSPSCGDRASLRDADGCLARGAPLFWEQPCVSFSVQQLGSSALDLPVDTLEGVVTRAFMAWQDARCDAGSPSITVFDLGPLECDRREFNSTGPNANGVYFIDEGWPHNPDAIALTTVSFDPETGKIFGADLEINSGEYPLSAEALEFVVTHEAGHFFGIDHSPYPDAVMYAEYSIFEGEGPTAEPMLTPDDIAAICAAYPPDRAVSAVCEPEPEHGYAPDCGGNVVGTCSVGAGRPRRPEAPGLLAMGALGLFGLVLRRRAVRRNKLLVVPPRRV